MDLPEVEHAAYLLQYLYEIGEARSYGQTLAPIDWQEITAWQHATGTALTTWDARMIRHLSTIYVGMYIEAGDPNCPAPWLPELPSADRINKRLDSLMGTLEKKA